MAVKRVLFSTPRSGKRAKTNPQLTRDVAKLKRAVSINKPELKQAQYTISLSAGQTAATNVLANLTIDGDQFKLHRLRVATFETNNSTTEAAWGILYSPRQGFSTVNGLYNTGDANSHENLLIQMDSSKQRLWIERHQSVLSTSVSSTTTGGYLVLDKKWSIPMIVGMQGSATVGNQVYWIGSRVTGASTQTLYVTVWYTDN